MFPNYQYPQYPVQRSEVIRVNGENGARALNLAPNSSALVLDETAPLVWLCQTDGAGYKTVIAYDIAPHKSVEQANMASLESRVARIEEILNGKSDTVCSDK